MVFKGNKMCNVGIGYQLVKLCLSYFCPVYLNYILNLCGSEAGVSSLHMVIILTAYVSNVTKYLRSKQNKASKHK